MLSIKKAKYLGDYKLELVFSDGRQGKVDLHHLIFDNDRTVFSPLKDKNLFKNFTVNYTIIWNEDLDLAPEYLYFKAFESDGKLQDQFKQWGYVA